MSLSFLNEFDLTTTEVQIYEYLVKNGLMTPSLIAKNLNLKRPTVYKALYSLEKNSLVIKKEITKKIHFQAASPSKIIDLIAEKEKAFMDAKKTFNSLLPALSSEYISSTEKPIVRIYEGLEGVKEIYIDILKEVSPGWTILQIEDMDAELGEWIRTYFTPKRVKNKIPLKAIVAAGKHAEKFKEEDKERYRFSRIVPSETFPFEHEVTGYGDKIAFIHYKKNTPLIGVVIKHPYFAKTMKAMFDLGWIGADENNN